MPAVRDLLQAATRHLHGDESSREAEILLAHTLGKSRAWLVAHAGDRLDGPQPAAYEALITRRASGEPIAYLVGARGFHELELEVTPDVLIPRPETELLVELALARIPVGSPDQAAGRRHPGITIRATPDSTARHPGYRIADLGTGSGAIALAIARARPRANVLATDASEAALAVARRNAVRNDIANVSFALGDWCAALGDARFDLIVSNPPYVAAGDPHLQEGDLRFEPSLALSPGADGLGAIRAIVHGARANLHDDAWLMFEHGFDQGAAVRALLREGGYRDVATHRDLEGRERVSGARAP